MPSLSESDYPIAVVAETADPELLARPLRGLSDIEGIESVPLDQRLGPVDFYQRIDVALRARAPQDTAVYFVPDGDVDGPVDEVSFARLRRQIDRTAALLASRGIGRTDAVGIILPTMPDAYWAVIGAMSRAIPFPLNWMLEPEPLLELLLEAKIKALIALGPTPGFKIWDSVEAIRDRLPPGIPIWSVSGPGGEPIAESDLSAALERLGDIDIQERPSRAQADDVAAYIHSGGTTGRPKIIKVSHGNLAYRHFTLQLAQQVTLGEVMPQDTPIFHVGGLAGRWLPMVASGVSLVIPSIMGARDRRYIANYWKFVERFGLTRLSGVPTMFAGLVKSPPQGEDLSSLKRCFMTGSTALPIAVRRQFERISGVRILNSYGLTENTASVAVEPRDGTSVEGSSGVRLPYTRIRVVALDSAPAHPRLCGPKEAGMLQVQGPGVTLGYLSSAHTEASRTPDGWLITGDLGRLDEDGNLFVTGRAKDVIIRGGHNIDPGPIEEALLQSPQVLHAAAVGKPDAYAGELPVAYVQLAPGSQITEAELIELASRGISERPAIPKEVFILEKLPLTDVGKPMKAALRQDAAERAFSSALLAIPQLGVQGASFEVKVGPDPEHGTLVTIVIAPPEATAAALVEQVQKTMDQYSFAYRVQVRPERD
ncbi:MAG: AMP-dependent synthetase and ligase [Caulobacteraceae bacterium]|nr:AMP-dependent synthetase and ligase [Caulobacteraceae bacterium]